MEIVKGKTYTDEPVEVDERYFFDCNFVRCTLIYSGGDAPSFDKCVFDSPQISLQGAASRTMGFIRDLYHSPFRSQVETTFENIRAGREQERIHNHGTGNESEQ